jgi:surface polysaccharide O-acyltransferase-like enzyme
MLIIAFLEMLFRPFYPGLQTLIGDWANFFVYLSFFIFGFIMGQSKELFQIIEKKKMLFFLFSIISTVLFFYIKRFSNLSLESYKVQAILNFFWGIAAYSWVLFYLGFFKKYINKPSKLLKYLSKTSFHLYVFHYFIISVILYFLIKSKMSHYLIWILTTILTYVAFVIMYELISRIDKIIKKK